LSLKQVDLSDPSKRPTTAYVLNDKTQKLASTNILRHNVQARSSVRIRKNQSKKTFNSSYRNNQYAETTTDGTSTRVGGGARGLAKYGYTTGTTSFNNLNGGKSN